jgi:hypothetical protein
MRKKPVQPKRQEIPYWLCCGSRSAMHDNERCLESKINAGHCRFGTLTEHKEYNVKNNA